MSSFQHQQQNSYLTEKDVDKINKSLIPIPRPRLRPPETETLYADIAHAPRPMPLIITIDIDRHLLMEEDLEGCPKETKKICCMWAIYCMCVCHRKWLLKFAVVLAAFTLPSLEIYLLLHTHAIILAKTSNLLFMDSAILIALVFLTMLIEYLLYAKTSREIMLSPHNTTFWTDNYVKIKMLKYISYMCVLIIKSIGTSIGLSYLVQCDDSRGALVALVGVTLSGQCAAILWCLCFLTCCRLN